MPNPQEWIVVLECTRVGVRTTEDELSSLMASLAPMSPSGLPGTDRYALQVHVVTATAPDAMRVATARWEEALAHLGFAGPALVRAEVLTVEEFEWECATGLAALPPVSGLATWELLRHHLEYSLASAGDDRTVALVVIELHPGADPREAPARLKRLLRPTDVIAPITESTFAALLEDTSERVATAVARRLAEGVGTPARPATVGFALSEQGDNGDALIARAGDAVDRARSGEGPGRRQRPGP